MVGGSRAPDLSGRDPQTCLGSFLRKAFDLAQDRCSAVKKSFCGTLFVALFLVLTLVSCAETAEEMTATATLTFPSSADASSTETPTTGTRSVEITLPATEVATQEPAEAPAGDQTTFTPPTSTLPAPLPAFLRELNLGIPAGNSYGPRAMTLHAGLGRLYVRTHVRSGGEGDTGLVAVLDLESGEVLEVVATGPDPYAEGDLPVDTVRNRLYTLNPDDNTATVLDAESLEVMEKLQGASSLALDAEGGRIYVAGMGGLRALDAGTYEALDQVSMGYAPRFLALAVDPENDRVYLAYEDQGGYFLAQFDASTLAPLVATALPGRINDLAPNPNRGQVYVTLDDGERSLFWTLDGDGSLVDEQVLGEWTNRALLALDLEGDRLFLGRDVYGDYGITVLDLATGRELDNVPLDQAPNGLAWDGISGRLLASHTYVHQLSIIDLASGQVAAVWPTALDLVDLALDAKRGHLYLTDSAGRLRVLDSDSDVVLAWLVGEGRVSVDSPHGRLYTGGHGAGRVRVFDSDRLQQTGEIESRAVPVADAYNGGLYLVRGGVHIASLETMTVTGIHFGQLAPTGGLFAQPLGGGCRRGPWQRACVCHHQQRHPGFEQRQLSLCL